MRGYFNSPPSSATAEGQKKEDLRAVKSESLRGDPFRELEREDAHPDEVRPMDPLEALGHDRFHPEKVRALGSPIAARASPVFLARKNDQRDSVGLVGHARVVDESWLSVLAFDFLIRRDDFQVAKIERIASFHSGNHEVLDS